jgi:beta-lactam-binding protein with PASTA domain
MKQEDAIAALQDARLLAQVTETPNNKQPKGRVWQQSPLAGTSVRPGTTVTIFVNPN